MHEILKKQQFRTQLHIDLCKLLSHPSQMANLPEKKQRAEMTGGRMAFQSAGIVNATVQKTDGISSNSVLNPSTYATNKRDVVKLNIPPGHIVLKQHIKGIYKSPDIFKIQ